MKKVLNDFVDSFSNGLLLLPLPTGFGKTWQIVRFIFEQINKDEDTKIIFVSSNLKNIKFPFEDLKGIFKENNKENEFEQICICLKENVKYLLDNFENVENDIQKELKEAKGYKEIKKIFNKYKNLEQNEELKKEMLSELREPERLFRNEIRLRYFDKKMSKQAKIKLLESKEFQWLRTLYPSSKSYEKRVFFMSASKFYFGNSTIIEPTTAYYNDELKNTIVIIDEIDESKNTFLKHIFEESLNEYDILDTAKNIFKALKSQTKPAKLETDSKANLERIDENKKYKSAKEMLKHLDSCFDELNAKHKVEFNFKYEQDMDSKDEYMFNDIFSMRPITLGSNEVISYSHNKAQNINNIMVYKKQNDEEYDKSFIGFLGDTLNTFETFSFWVDKLALNYKELKDESSEFKISQEDALKSVLDEFNISQEAKKYFCQKNYFVNKNAQSLWDEFYSNAFRILKITNSTDFDLKSKILISDYYKSPEMILEKIAKKALVIGLSATADIDSIFSNYSLELLKQRLKDTFCSIYDERFKDDLFSLESEFKNKLKGYENINIQAKAISGICDYNTIYSKELILEAKKAEKKESNGFELYRFSKLDNAISEFVKDDKLKSMLCFTNKNYTDELSLLCLKELKKHNISIEVLTSKNFEEKLKDIKNRLSLGQKICVISSYATASVGQNLQYKAPKDIKLIKIGNMPSSDEKDFDAIYLENYSNVVVNSNEYNLANNEKYKAVYQTKSLRQRGEITKKDFDNRLNSIFNNKIIKLKEGNSFEGAIAAKTIQSIGRLSRTNQKNEKICIFFDEDIKFKQSIVNKRLKTPEFLAFLEQMSTQENNQKTTIDKEVQKNLDICECSKKLLDMLLGSIRKGKKDKWQELRELVLKYPTMNQNQYEQISGTNDALFYIKLPKESNSYGYTKEGDFEKITNIVFDNQPCLLVNQSLARLDDLMKISGLKEYFKQKGYATSFEKNSYIMSPIIFNNIYKGALGEVAVEYIFKTELEIQFETLDKMDEFYEFFDYKIGDIYIDAKNWSEYAANFNKEKIQKAQAKLEALGGKKAIIVNVFAQNRYKEYSSDKICVIPRLFDGTKIDKEALKTIKDFINAN